LELLSSTPAGQVKIPTGMNFWAGLKKQKKKVGGSPANGSKKILNTIFNLQPRRERERENLRSNSFIVV